MLIVVVCIVSWSAFGESHRVQLSDDDTFRVSALSKWNMKKLEYVENKKATFSFVPEDNSFVLKLFFMRDQIDEHSAARMLQRVSKDLKRFEEKAFSKNTIIEGFDDKKVYGLYGVLKDLETAKRTNPKSNDFLYMTRGRIRLSPETVLGFFMLTHEKDGAVNDRLKRYMCDFSKLKL